MKKFLLLLCMAMPLLAACNTNSDSDTLTVISYNLRNNSRNEDDPANNWDNRKPASKAMIDTEKPDIFGVQEAYPSQENYLLEVCPKYKAVGVCRDNGVDEGERMSIFWNTETVELLDWGTYWLSETPDVPSFGWDAACRRTATWAFMKHIPSGRKFFYVNTHLDHIGVEARRNGVALVEAKIAEMNSENVPMILTGDFNIPDDDPTILEIDSRMMNSRNVAKVTDRKLTYNGWGNEEEACRIDYVYSKGFSGCDLFKTLDGNYVEGIKYISDHYPVKAVLRW